MDKKKTILILGMFGIIFMFFGGSLAYWTWTTSSEQQTNVVFTVEKDFECAADGGGNITSEQVSLVPTDCTNSTYAIKREVTVTPTVYDTELAVSMDLWLDVNSLGTGLSNSKKFSYALTTSETSCTEGVISKGNFYGKIANDMVKIFSKNYDASTTETYWLYIWLDKAETDSATMNQTFDLSLNGSCTNTPVDPFFAIYSADDTSLRFYSGTGTDISVGDTYNDLIVTEVYTGLEDDVYSKIFLETVNPPWYSNNESITSVVVEDEISPINASYLFSDLVNITSIDVTNLNTSNVTSMKGMFSGAGENVATFEIIGMNNWDVSNVTNMSSMFSSAGKSVTNWSLDLSGWDVSKVTDMSMMFYYAGKSAATWSIGDLSGWDTSNVTDMSSMFSSAGYNATTLTIDGLSDWDVFNVTSMNGMFSSAGYSSTTWNIGDLSGWDVSKVTDMRYMFSSLGYKSTTWSIGDLSGWDVSNVTDMSYMFNNVGYSATTFNIGDISDWDTSSVTDMSNMFRYAGYNATNWSLDLSGWDTSSVTTMSYMFSYAGENAITFGISGISNWNTANVTNMSMMFSSAGENATSWSVGDLSGWDVSNVTDMSSMFNDAGKSATTWSIGNISTWNTSNVTDMSYMFKNAGYTATNWLLDLAAWNVISVQDYSNFDTGVEDKIISPWDVDVDEDIFPVE